MLAFVLIRFRLKKLFLQFTTVIVGNLAAVPVLFYLPDFLRAHGFTFNFSELFCVYDVKKLLPICFLLAFVSDFMKIVEIDLTYKRGVVSMFKISREYLFSEFSYVFDGEGSFQLIVKNDFLIFFVLNR